MKAIQHIHHISAIVGNPAENIKFYRDVLQLKLIKKTVNYDDPSTYHLYFSNDSVDNGTILTFFNWPDAYKGRVGAGQVSTIAFRIPQGTTDVWEQHLINHNVHVTRMELFDSNALMFKDTHGLSLALVEDKDVRDTAAIIGFHGVTMLSEQPEKTIQLLTAEMGLKQLNDKPNETHLVTVGEWQHHVVVKKVFPNVVGRWGVGVVHHIAWSVPDEQTQLDWRTSLVNKGYKLTDVKERFYFKAVYMAEPGNIIFEFATAGPGFTIDEPFDKLGRNLMLPPRLEEQREELERQLPTINI
jgi:glyoxalase family protein